MFKLTQNKVRYLIGLSLLIVLFDLTIVNTPLFTGNDQLLTIGVSLDFVVVLPIFVYLLIYRNSNKNMMSIIPFVFVGYLALLLIVPAAGQGTLEIVKYIVIPLELMFLSYQVYKWIPYIIHYRRNRLIDSHPLETFGQTIEAAFNHSKISLMLVHELSVFYYALLAWRKKPYVQTNSTSFSYHKDSNWLIIILFLSKLLLIEGICIHILLMQWSHPVAWLISIGNLYVIVLLLADYRAMCLNPILVSKQGIRVQYGLQMSAYIDIHNIESVSVIKFEKLNKDELKTSVIPVATEPNIRICLTNKAAVVNLIGMRQMVHQIYLYLDKPDEFHAEYLRQRGDNESRPYTKKLDKIID